VIGRVPEIGDAGQLGCRILEQLQPFSGELLLDRQRLSCLDSAGMGKAGDYPRADWIGHDKNHRDRQRRRLGGKRGRHAAGNENLDVQARQVLDLFDQAIAALFRGPDLDYNVLAFDIAVLAQTLAEAVEPSLPPLRRLATRPPARSPAVARAPAVRPTERQGSAPGPRHAPHPQRAPRSLDDLVGEVEDGGWDGQTQRHGRLQVDNQLEPSGLLNGQVGGLGAL